jgi:hypothetical protein
MRPERIEQLFNLFTRKGFAKEAKEIKDEIEQNRKLVLTEGLSSTAINSAIIREIEDYQKIQKRLLDNLMDMVEQHCGDCGISFGDVEYDWYFSRYTNANARAIRTLIEFERIECVQDDSGRTVTGRRRRKGKENESEKED